MDPIITYSIIVLGAIGLGSGIILSLASKKFAVWEDPKLKKIESVLPNINCGACGYAGCARYAEAVASQKAELNLCIPGGKKVADALGQIMGKNVCAKEPMVAKMHCNGGIKEAKIKFDYSGIETCKAASIINNGFKLCSFSCLGFGDCVLVCPVNAIVVDNNKIAKVDKEKCIGCAKCVKECPKMLYEMVPKKSLVHVLCSNKELGKYVMKECTVGCIACKLCEKACPSDAIHVINNIAIIDYTKCTSCAKCVAVCPKKCIIQEIAPKKKQEKKPEGADAAVEGQSSENPEQKK